MSGAAKSTLVGSSRGSGPTALPHIEEQRTTHILVHDRDDANVIPIMTTLGKRHGRQA
jgi:hypothetical protein